ncbi:MAG: hypothetical protein ACI84R_003568 [Candidatus Azotimanducaceae bacterium]|jgi:hypothetical protein
MTNFIDYVSGIGPLEWMGVAGFICYIVAFGSVQIGKLDGNSTAYSLINVVAASLVAMSLFAEFNLASALIQSSWILIGVTGLALRANQSWPAAREVLDTTLENGAS